MNQMIINSTTIGVVISVMGYELGLLLKRKFKSAIFNPLLISIIFVICCLLLFRVDYDNYNKSAQYLSYLLTPATVCLAIPLYQQIKLLKENVVAIIAGIISGVLTSLVFIFVFALIFNFGHEEYVTLLPKSITTAIGMGISEELGGYVTITVAVIMISGVLGNICGEAVCKIFKITILLICLCYLFLLFRLNANLILRPTVIGKIRDDTIAFVSFSVFMYVSHIPF